LEKARFPKKEKKKKRERKDLDGGLFGGRKKDSPRILEFGKKAPNRGAVGGRKKRERKGRDLLKIPLGKKRPHVAEKGVRERPRPERERGGRLQPVLENSSWKNTINQIQEHKKEKYEEKREALIEQKRKKPPSSP